MATMLCPGCTHQQEPRARKNKDLRVRPNGLMLATRPTSLERSYGPAGGLENRRDIDYKRAFTGVLTRPGIWRNAHGR